MQMRRWKNLSQIIQREVVLVIGALLIVAVNVSIVLAAHDPCEQDCEELYVDQAMIFGGQECAHGPENDTDCPTPLDPAKDCFELNGGTGDCKCFECGLDDGCENRIMLWKAWCGVKSATNDGDCLKEAGATGTTSQSWDMTIVGGGACPYTGGFVTKEYCGGGAAVGACIGGSGCVLVFGTLAEGSGTRDKCKESGS